MTATPDASSSRYGVHSEVGTLRKVLVCRPGLAHRRLTPTNCDDLLFDDVMWVENAQRDHADFVNKMTNRGVEVVELHELIAADHGGAGRARLDARPGRSCPTRSASASSTAPGSFLETLTHANLAEYLIGGLATATCPTDSARPYVELVRSRPVVREYLMPPAAQHPLHPRHHLLALRRRDPQPALLAGPPRRDAAVQGSSTPFHPDFVGVERVVGRPGAGLGAGHHRGRRRHAGRQRRRAHRDERAHLPPGHHPGRQGPVRPGRPPSRSSSPACPSCAPPCTWTPCSRSPTVTSSPTSRRSSTRSTRFSLRPSDTAPGIDVTDEGGTASSTSWRSRWASRSCALLETGGDVYASERQQWDSGNNAVALEPGVVVHLRPQHLHEHAAASSRGRGHHHRRRRARPRPRRRPLHDLPDHPRPCRVLSTTARRVSPVAAREDASGLTTPGAGPGRPKERTPQPGRTIQWGGRCTSWCAPSSPLTRTSGRTRREGPGCAQRAGSPSSRAHPARRTRRSSMSSASSDATTNSADVPGVTWSRTWLTNPSSIPTSCSGTASPLVGSPTAAASSGAKKTTPSSRPQNTSLSAPG